MIAMFMLRVLTYCAWKWSVFELNWCCTGFISRGSIWHRDCPLSLSPLLFCTICVIVIIEYLNSNYIWYQWISSLNKTFEYSTDKIFWPNRMRRGQDFFVEKMYRNNCHFDVIFDVLSDLFNWLIKIGPILINKLNKSDNISNTKSTLGRARICFFPLPVETSPNLSKWHHDQSWKMTCYVLCFLFLVNYLFGCWFC